MQVAKTAATGGRSEHCCHTLLQFSAPLNRGNDPPVAILEAAACSPCATIASVPGSVRNKKASEICEARRGLVHRSQPIWLKAASQHSVVNPPPIWHGRAFRQRPQATNRITNGCKNFKEYAERKQSCCRQAACGSKRGVIRWLRCPTCATKQKYRRRLRNYTWVVHRC